MPKGHRPNAAESDEIPKQYLMRCTCSLASMRAVEHGSRLCGLEGASPMKFAIGATVSRLLATEIEIRLRGITEWPTTVIGQKRCNRLPLGKRDFWVGFTAGRGTRCCITHDYF